MTGVAGVTGNTPQGQPTTTTTENRWAGRPLLANAIRALAFLIPVVAAISATTIARHFLPIPVGIPAAALWLLTLLAVSVLVVFVFDKLTRRLLPLATLYRLTLLFPDRAPSRFAVARKAGGVRVLEERAKSGDEEPANAAEAILLLAASISEHDKRTRGHSERVRVYVDMIAEELKLHETDRDRLRWSALLHDVGKLSVPADILNKDGRPDDDEWARIRTHPAEGMRVAARLLPWLGEWAGAIGHHHERWDGNGYPDGLHGRDISFGGRIVAVADAYEVITAARPYKKPMSVGTAREELARCAGTDFDPTIVRAFLNIAIGRLRGAAGPLAWLAQLPFLGEMTRLGQRAADLAGTFGTTALGTAKAVAFSVPLVAATTAVVPAASTPVVTARPARTPGVNATPEPFALGNIVPTDASPTPIASATLAPSGAPTAAPVVAVTPLPAGATPKPPTPKPAPTPVPTPPPVGAASYFLASYREGDAQSRFILPLRASAPTAAALPNYDTDRNADPGLSLQPLADKASPAPGEYQLWMRRTERREPIKGRVTSTFYSALANFRTGRPGRVQGYLVDCPNNSQDGSGCKVFGTADLSLPDWSGGSSGWVAKTIDFGNVKHDVDGGRYMGLALLCRSPTQDAMWIAYDTTAQPSSLSLPPV